MADRVLTGGCAVAFRVGLLDVLDVVVRLGVDGVAGGILSSNPSLKRLVLLVSVGTLSDAVRRGCVGISASAARRGVAGGILSSNPSSKRRVLFTSVGVLFVAVRLGVTGVLVFAG